MPAPLSESPMQLVLELPHRQALGAEDFLVSRSNAAAVEFIDSWPCWPRHAVLVTGPEGCGKSHLANVWRLKSGANTVAAPALADAAVQSLESRGALVIEDIDRGLADERTLFHLLNLAREKGHSLLLTSRAAPGEIGVAIADLRSRLRALALAKIEAPDEALLKAVLVKLFADRQLVVEPHVVAYLGLHMERSMAAASQVVTAADRLSLAKQRKVTRAIAADALSTLGRSSESD